MKHFDFFVSFVAALFSAQSLAVDAQHVVFGDMPEDALVPTGKVVSVEADEIALAALSGHAGSTSNPHGVTAAQVGAVPGMAGTGGHSLGVDIYRGTDISKTTLTAGGVAVKASTGITTFGKDGISKTASGGTWVINTTGASLSGSVPTPWSFAWADLIQRPEMVATNAAIYERIEEKADIADIGKWSDIATNIVYHVVVSNGHWLIIEEQ
jgi:hypothetical protein